MHCFRPSHERGPSCTRTRHVILLECEVEGMEGGDDLCDALLQHKGANAFDTPIEKDNEGGTQCTNHVLVRRRALGWLLKAFLKAHTAPSRVADVVCSLVNNSKFAPETPGFSLSSRFASRVVCETSLSQVSGTPYICMHMPSRSTSGLVRWRSN